MKKVSQPYHGGQFEGPKCQKILKNISSLQQFAEKHASFNHGNYQLLEKIQQCS